MTAICLSRVFCIFLATLLITTRAFSEFLATIYLHFMFTIFGVFLTTSSPFINVCYPQFSFLVTSLMSGLSIYSYFHGYCPVACLSTVFRVFLSTSFTFVVLISIIWS